MQIIELYEKNDKALIVMFNEPWELNVNNKILKSYPIFKNVVIFSKLTVNPTIRNVSSFI